MASRTLRTKVRTQCPASARPLERQARAELKQSAILEQRRLQPQWTVVRVQR